MAKRGRLTIGKTRSALYWTARLLGDVSAVKHRRIVRRVRNRVVGRMLRSLFRW